jgi:enolase-phosphatase E1
MGAVLTDIEGTTTAVSFVTHTLFPYARARIPAWVEQAWGQEHLAPLIDSMRAEAGADTPGALIAAMLGWMDDDRKITSLKAVQGMIWEAGYGDGSLRSHLYSDVAPALRRWRAAGRTLAVYSSGSEQAQRLLFGHTPDGDLCGLFSAFFDTRVGAKRAAQSYRVIAERLGLPGDEVRFLSDVVEELDAAAEAGMHTVLLVRESAPPARCAHRVARSFDEL